MARYALLVLPSSNRVYAEASTALTRAELAVFNESVLDGRLSDIGELRAGGVSYVTFHADALSEADLGFLSNLSSMYAMFEVVGELLRPLELRSLDRFDDDLVTILKYQGKTNERFTKLLLNVTLLSSAFAGQMCQRRFAVIDPLCGRGTTLNQALRYGFDAAGVDLDHKDFDLYSAFLKTWLRRKRVKHKAETVPVRRERRLVARRFRVELAASKEEYRAGETQLLDVVNADTMNCLDFFRPGTFDLLVTDAPYGVQHGSQSSGHGLARDPLALLTEAAPVWAKLLAPGGALGVAWNTHAAKRDAVVSVFADAGLEVMGSGPYLEFAHWVDQAITRDVVVARKPHGTA